MSQNLTDMNVAAKSSVVMFDHEKLDVYQVELQFIAWVTPLLEDVSKSAVGKTREVCDQLDRASLSTLLRGLRFSKANTHRIAGWL